MGGRNQKMNQRRPYQRPLMVFKKELKKWIERSSVKKEAGQKFQIRSENYYRNKDQALKKMWPISLNVSKLSQQIPYKEL